MLPHQKISYLPLLEVTSVEDLAQKLDLGNITNEPQDNSSGNESFKIVTTKGIFQVKRYSKSIDDPEHYAPLIQREIGFTRYISGHGILVQKPVTFQPLCWNGMLTTVTPYIEGTPLPSGMQNEETITKIATLVGNLHKNALEYGTIGAAYEQRNSFREAVDSHSTEIEKLLDTNAGVFIPILDYYQELRKKRTTNDLILPRALVHSELTPIHLIQTNNNIAIIDFEGLKFAPLIFDFGQLFLSMMYDMGTFNMTLVETFLKSYEAVRPVTPQERTSIPDELAYNYLHKLEWRMTAMLNKPGYVEIVKQQLREWSAVKEQLSTIAL